MKRLVPTILVLMLMILAAPRLAAAAENYYEGWDNNDVAGWTQNTIHDTVYVVNAGGNPAGYLQCARLPGGFVAIGATTNLPEASGDYASAGVFEVSFDVLFDSGTFTSAVFRARFSDPTHNGWSIPFTNDFTPGVWRSYVIAFDPTWSDAEALAAGWSSDGDPGLTFAQTFSDVFHPEIRIDGVGEPLAACIDNFRIRACADKNIVLNADFNADTPGLPPDLTLPGAPTGDFLLLSELSGTVRVSASVGTLTDQPILMDQVPGIGSVHVFAHPAPNECNLIRAGWNSLARSNDIFFLACVVRDPGGLIIASVEYRPNGELTYNSAGTGGGTLPVTYTPDVDQRFEILVDLLTNTTSISVDGVPMAGFQNVGFYQPAATGFGRLGFEAGGTIAQQFAFDNVVLSGCDCGEDPCAADATAPTIEITLSRDTLWPPNHKLVEICATVDVSDECDPAPVVTLVSITSDEPDNGLGDGDTEDDIQSEDVGTDDDCFLLRSERQGGGDGRVYTITYCVTDASGNQACATAEVVVPHDQSGSAFASLGFSADGTRLQQGATEYALVIRSTSTFDASLVDPSRTFVGNHMGVYAPTRFDLVDVERDGLSDLRLFFDASPTYQMLREDEQGIPTVALRYETVAGVGYIVPDIFALGPPIAVLTGISTLGDGRALVTHAQPNPFTASTEVRYSVAGGRVELVDIAVYDVSGRLVRSLYQGTRGPGSYVAAWDARNDEGAAAGAGVYFLRADVGGRRAFERLVLLR